MGNNGVELSARDALVGEVLGELVLVRKGVEEFKAAVPPMVEQLKDAGELVSRRLDDQARHIVAELDERTKTLNAAANEFRDVRELLMAEVATKTTAHFEDVLNREARRMARGRRVELALAAMGGSLVTATLVAVVLLVWKLV
jgi:hypothetical protein